MKLLLQGTTKNEGGKYDPWPVVLPGGGVIPSNKVEEYVNADFFYYYQFYTNCKHTGAPLSGGWTEWPPWIPQLIAHFDTAIDAVRRHNELQAYKQRWVNG